MAASLAEIETIVYIFSNGKAGKVLNQVNSEAIEVVSTSY
jgi:hypothetical protein